MIFFLNGNFIEKVNGVLGFWLVIGSAWLEVVFVRRRKSEKFIVFIAVWMVFVNSTMKKREKSKEENEQ